MCRPGRVNTAWPCLTPTLAGSWAGGSLPRWPPPWSSTRSGKWTHEGITTRPEKTLSTIRIGISVHIDPGSASGSPGQASTVGRSVRKYYDNALARRSGLYKTELVKPGKPGGPSSVRVGHRAGSTGLTIAASTVLRRRPAGRLENLPATLAREPAAESQIRKSPDSPGYTPPRRPPYNHPTYGAAAPAIATDAGPTTARPPAGDRRIKRGRRARRLASLTPPPPQTTARPAPAWNG